MNQNRLGFLDSIPPVTKNIIFINIICFLAMLVMRTKGIDLNELGALKSIESGSFHPYQLITYMFLHASLEHIFFNMFAVFIFSRTLEVVWGSKRFFIYYMITGIGAGLVQLLIIAIRVHSIQGGLNPNLLALVYNNDIASIYRLPPDTIQQIVPLFELVHSSVIGASGAVFGILLAFGMQFPNAELFIIPIPVPIKAKYFVIGYGVIELTQGVINRSGDNVAHFAHLGGLLFGLILILYWRKTNQINGGFH